MTSFNATLRALAAPAWLLLVALSLPVVLPAQEGDVPEAREEILVYDVRVEVGDGGVMRVNETIEVRALGREIRRGIYRDFPTRFPREVGWGHVVAPFRVVSVERDGRSEPYRLETVGGPAGRSGVRVRIGDPDVHLKSGVHRYHLVYETARWLRFGEGRDLLRWNVTGNGWAFPILEARAAIELPGSVPEELVNLEAWTGPLGSDAQAADWSWSPEERTARFRTTGPLGPREGLTVEMALPSGVVPPPTEEQKAAWFDLDWGGFVETGVVALAVLALYLFMWVRVGRDPAEGTIMVRYEPPEGFSPAGLGFLRERGYEPAQLTAALVSLAVNGAVTIERDDGQWKVRGTGAAPEGAAPEERALFDAAVGPNRTLTLEGTSNSRLRKGVESLKKKLERRIEKIYFVTNRRWFAAGVVLSLAGFAVLAWRARYAVPPEAWFIGVWLSFWTLGVGTLLYRVVRTWSRVPSGGLGSAAEATFLTLFSVPFVAAEIFVGGLLYFRVPRHLVAAAVILALVNVVFYHLLERPTMKGRGVLDHLDGFRRFLGATEEDRMNRLQDPERSLELFERFLPHAIALGVENEWASRFEDALAPGTEAGDGHLRWYAGGGHGLSLSGMSSSLGSSLSSSLSASSAAPSSSGGGGGGGFSGGGGGGGGGGGW